MLEQIPKGTPVEITGISPKDSYSMVYSSMAYAENALIGLKGKAGELLELNEREKGFYQGDFIKDNGSRMFFYAVKLKVLEGGENNERNDC